MRVRESHPFPNLPMESAQQEEDRQKWAPYPSPIPRAEISSLTPDSTETQTDAPYSPPRPPPYRGPAACALPSWLFLGWGGQALPGWATTAGSESRLHFLNKAEEGLGCSFPLYCSQTEPQLGLVPER